ncbi:MAG: hypothetical protein WD512_10235, partial [Candidatus Paceibacterota bacterium]
NNNSFLSACDPKKNTTEILQNIEINYVATLDNSKKDESKKDDSNSKKDDSKKELPSDKDKLLLINSRRVFHIAEEGRNYQEREDLARTYFDRVLAIEANPKDYQNHTLLLQIYIMNKDNRDSVNDKIPNFDLRGDQMGNFSRNEKNPNIYGFRPIQLHSYLFHRLIKNGALCGNFKDLKQTIDWTYLPLSVEDKETVKYICSPSFFKRKLRDRLLEDMAKRQVEYKNDYNWIFWPDLD